MKIKLLLAFIALSLASCSSDDRSNSDPTETPTGDRILDKIVQTDFNGDGSIKLTTKTSFDDKDRALLQMEYDGTGQLSAKRDFTYNPSGQLETMTLYTAVTGLETPNYSYTITYDGSGRVTTLSDSFIYNNSPATSVTTYVYSQSIVTATRIFSYGGTVITSYLLNAEGKVFKKLTTGGSEQLAYIGENIQNYSNGNSTSIFVYDAVNKPMGQQHNVIVNQYNGNMANTLMLGGFTSIELGRTNYVLKRIDGNGDQYDYNYDFDEDGYPIKLRYTKNDASIPFSIREISYK